MPRRSDEELLMLTAEAAPMACCRDAANLRVTHSEERAFAATCEACGRTHRRALLHDIGPDQRAAVEKQFRIT